jgi:ribonuclease BN (tRNA processing enzyme)
LGVSGRVDDADPGAEGFQRAARGCTSASGLLEWVSWSSAADMAQVIIVYQGRPLLVLALRAASQSLKVDVQPMALPIGLNSRTIAGTVEEEPWMELRLTVLTSAAGRSSGYLLEAAGRRVLVDCGPGVVAALASYGGPEGLDAVVVTHAHADHCLDLMGMGYALRCPDPLDRRLPLLLPEDAAVVARHLDELFGVPTSPEMARPIAQAFIVRSLVLEGSESVELFPGLNLEAFPAKHPVQSAALRFTVSGAVVTFSSDTCWTDSIIAAASDASLFVCEATHLEADQGMLERQGHLTARLAGRLARAAGARRLLLSHLSYPGDAAQALTDATESYEGWGPVEVATPALTLTIKES